MTNTLFLKSHLNHTVNIQSGPGLSRVVGEKIPQTSRLHVVAVIALTFHSLSLRDPVLHTWCAIFKQFFMKIEIKELCYRQYIVDAYIYKKNINFLRIYISRPLIWTIGCGFKYLHYSVTLSLRGETHFLVFAQTLIYVNVKPIMW